MVEEATVLLKNRDFEWLVGKCKDLNNDLIEESKNSKRSATETNNAVVEKVRQIIELIVNEEFLGKERFNNITAHLRPPTSPIHGKKPPIIDLSVFGARSGKLLGTDSSTNIFQSLSQAKELISRLFKDTSQENKKLIHSVLSMLD